jgi:hypothetical protein
LHKALHASPLDPEAAHNIRAALLRHFPADPLGDIDLKMKDVLESAITSGTSDEKIEALEVVRRLGRWDGIKFLGIVYPLTQSRDPEVKRVATLCFDQFPVQDRLPFTGGDDRKKTAAEYAWKKMADSVRYMAGVSEQKIFAFLPCSELARSVIDRTIGPHNIVYEGK